MDTLEKSSVWIDEVTDRLMKTKSLAKESFYDLLKSETRWVIIDVLRSYLIFNETIGLT